MKNFILFCLATYLSAMVFMLASMIFDIVVTPNGVATTSQFGITASTDVAAILSAFLVLTILGLVVVFRSHFLNNVKL